MRRLIICHLQSLDSSLYSPLTGLMIPKSLLIEWIKKAKIYLMQVCSLWTVPLPPRTLDRSFISGLCLMDQRAGPLEIRGSILLSFIRLFLLLPVTLEQIWVWGGNVSMNHWIPQERYLHTIIVLVQNSIPVRSIFRCAFDATSHPFCHIASRQHVDFIRHKGRSDTSQITHLDVTFPQTKVWHFPSSNLTAQR